MKGDGQKFFGRLKLYPIYKHNKHHQNFDDTRFCRFPKERILCGKE